MIAKPFTSYSEIARIEFTTLRGIDVECVIKGLIGTTPKTFIATGNPLQITMLDGEDTFTRIKGSEATLSVHNLTDFAALQIMAEGNTDYVMEVYYNSSLIWTGFMMPDQWTEPLNTTPYPSTFRFIDGIALLKDIDFADSDGCYYRGYYRDSQIIGYCLSEIGLDRRFFDEINIIDENTDAPDLFGTMFEKFKNVEAFRGMTCYEVLENILKSYVSRIEFFDNKYHIRRIVTQETAVKSYEYKLNVGGGPSLQGVTTINPRQSINNARASEATRVTWTGSSQELYRLPGMKKLTITQDYGRKESIIPRSKLEACDFAGNIIKEWEQSGVARSSAESDTGILFPSTASELSPIQYIRGSSQDSYSNENATGSDIDYFQLEIVCRNVEFLALGRNEPGRRGGSSIVATLQGNNVDPATGFQARPRLVNILTSDELGTPYFYINAHQYGYLDDLDWVGDDVDLIFTDPDDLPTGIEVGTPYRIVVVNIETETIPFPTKKVWFVLSLTSNPLTFIPVSASDVGNLFPGSLYFYKIPSTLKFSGENIALGSDGGWIDYGFLNFELPLQSLKSFRFFSVAATSTSSLPGTLLKPLEIYLGKPILNINPDNRNSNFFIESIYLTIIGTPENTTEEITLNARNKERYELNIMFAETPIKNNFVNNKLKFYNNFFSRSLTTEPGLQYIDIPDAPTTPTTLYDYIKNTYSALLQKHRYALAGTLFSDQILLPGKILSEQYTEKDYIQTSYTWNVSAHTYEVQMHEIGAAPEAVILGDFNDDYNDDYN